MNNLVVDIGNTAVKACSSEGLTLGRSFRYQGEKPVDFILDIASKKKPYVMVVSCVHIISESDRKRLSECCEILIILDPSEKQLIRDEKLPDYLTYDRVASILAARHIFKGKGVTIADFGTTLSVDMIDPEGKYEGGNVTVGCTARFKALHRYSKGFPQMDIPSDTPLLADNFEDSLSSGVISGIMFEIEGYAGIKPENIVVFTGGDAIYFAKRMKISIFVVCNLVLMGLALIADRYVKSEI